MSKLKKRDMERKGDKKQKIMENKLQEEAKTEVDLEELPEEQYKRIYLISLMPLSYSENLSHIMKSQDTGSKWQRLAREIK